MKRLEELTLRMILSRRLFLAWCAGLFTFSVVAALLLWPAWNVWLLIPCAGVQLFFGVRRYLFEPSFPPELGFAGVIRECSQCGAAVLCELRHRKRITCEDHTL